MKKIACVKKRIGTIIPLLFIIVPLAVYAEPALRPNSDGTPALSGIIPSHPDAEQRLEGLFSCSFAGTDGASSSYSFYDLTRRRNISDINLTFSYTDGGVNYQAMAFTEPGTYSVGFYFTKTENGVKKEANFSYQIEVAAGVDSAADAFAILSSSTFKSSSQQFRTRYQYEDGRFKQDTGTGRSPLHYAAMRGDVDAAKWHIRPNEYRPGSLLDAPDVKGETPLMLAAKAGHTEMVRFLVEAGALTFPVSDTGKTAFLYARDGGHSAAADILGRYTETTEIPAALISPNLWRGEIIDGYNLYLIALEIKKAEGRLKGTAIVTSNLTGSDTRRLSSETIDTVKENSAFAAEVEYDIYVQRNNFYALARNRRFIQKGAYIGDIMTYTFNLQGSLTGQGLITGLAEKRAGYKLFVLHTPGYLDSKPSFTLEKGKTIDLQCIDNPAYHYSCYIPKTYFPGKPTPLLLFDNAGGNAPPLSIETAENIGWISAGLTEARNDMDQETRTACWSAVLLDLRKRFSIDNNGVYFAGFSEGGRLAQARAFSYGDGCAGIISIGMGKEKELTVPVFLIFGDRDKQGNTSKTLPQTEMLQVRTAPGDHMWGFPKLHAEAIRWLHSRR